MPSLNDLISPRKRVRISPLNDLGFISLEGLVEFDASIEETHSAENDVTDYPVEQGSNITDNSRPKPRRLTLRAVITGTPMDITAIAIPPAVKARRGKDAWEKLDRWRKDGRLLYIFTPFIEYKGFVIQSLSVPRNAKNSDGAEFQIALQQVITVRAVTSALPKRDTKNQTVDKGKKGATVVDEGLEQKTNQSVAASLLDLF